MAANSLPPTSRTPITRYPPSRHTLILSPGARADRSAIFAATGRQIDTINKTRRGKRKARGDGGGADGAAAVRPVNALSIDRGEPRGDRRSAANRFPRSRRTPLHSSWAKTREKIRRFLARSASFKNRSPRGSRSRSRSVPRSVRDFLPANHFHRLTLRIIFLRAAPRGADSARFSRHVARGADRGPGREKKREGARRSDRRND